MFDGSAKRKIIIREVSFVKKLHDKIMSANLGKRLKRIILAALCVAVLGGGISAGLLWPQINEIVSTGQELRLEESKLEQEDRDGSNEKQDEERLHKEHDEKNQREYDKDHEEWKRLRASISRPSPAAFAAVGITILLLGLSGIAFWLEMTAWLYQKAVLAGMNGSLWALLGIAGNVFALVLFLVIREYIREKCPACGYWQEKGGLCCGRCGEKMHTVCPSCGAKNDIADRFCSFCGKKMDGE